MTCQEEEPELCLQKKASKAISNPIIGCEETAENCAKYSVIAKGFFSSYTQKIEQDVLDGAKNLIIEVIEISYIFSHPKQNDKEH